jgi:hypothetical protein
VASEVAGTETSAGLEAPVEPLKPVAAEPEPKPSQTRGPHHRRFLTLYVLLGLAVAGSVAGLVVAALGSNLTHSAAPPWSSWRPHGGGLGAVEEVTAHVAPQYKLPNGNQLVDVLTSAPSVTPDGKHTVPLQYIAVRHSGGDLDYAISGSNSVEFQLCGLGLGCSIATGTPSVARGNLVRREILELALYTFKYVPAIENVLAVMPPRPGTTSSAIIYVRRDDLSGLLAKPLAETLGKKTPLPDAIPKREVTTINAATAPHTFTAGVAATPQGVFVLVLKKLTA